MRTTTAIRRDGRRAGAGDTQRCHDSPAAPTPSYSRPHGLAVTRRSSQWDHATSLTRMTLQTVRPLVRAIV
jgi:hypothetical protein